MLSIAGLLPHPPFAIQGFNPSLDRAYASLHEAYARIGEHMQSRMIETIVFVSSHGEGYARAFAFAQHEPAHTSLREYGTMEYEYRWRMDTRLIDAAQRAFRKADVLTTLTTNEYLDTASGVALSALRPWVETMRVATLTLPSDAISLKRPAALLRDVIELQPSRIAILAVADLSHRLASKSPQGLHPDAQALDERIRHALIDQNLSALRAISQEERQELGAEEIPLVEFLLYVLSDARPHFQEWAYSHPHGIGHSVMIADLHV